MYRRVTPVTCSPALTCWSAPGVFGDREVRIHTGDPRERELLLFVKRAEAVELAVIFAGFTRMFHERRMSAEFFTDTWRQFTNHWEAGVHPPSGAADVEFIARDLSDPGPKRTLTNRRLSDGPVPLRRTGDMGRRPKPSLPVEPLWIKSARHVVAE